MCGVELADGRFVRGRRSRACNRAFGARRFSRCSIEMNVTLEPKGFALGVRVEHPQALINQDSVWSRCGARCASERLLSSCRNRRGPRGVFSFCMCPGGWIVPATTEAWSAGRQWHELVEAGLPIRQLRDRRGGRAAGLASSWLRRPLGGLRFQEKIERAAYEAGGGDLRAPATLMTDFLAKRGSSRVPESSYRPGLAATGLDEVLDSAGVHISEPLRAGLQRFTRRMPGFFV